jgi:[ribosomal protein S18]-alanine N-acetyltransferase
MTSCIVHAEMRSAARSTAVTISPMADADVAAASAIDTQSPMSEAQLREELARPFGRLWVARDDAGLVRAFLVSWQVADELHVLNVATHEAFRRQGIGRALMGVVIRFAQEQALRHVLLEVRRSNKPAIALYRAVGFFAMGVRSRYYPDDEDAVEMVLLFDPETRAIVPHADEVRLESKSEERT